MPTQTLYRTSKHWFIVLLGLIAAIILFAALPNTAGANIEADNLAVSARGMVATAEFTRSTPCVEYTLDWGDGETDVFTSDAEICIQMIDEHTVTHEYDVAGTYTATLELAGDTYTTEIQVPGEEIVFSLDDITNVTAEWVDPDPQMADEEYYIYTITLQDDTVITVKAGGFTTVEYRNEQFTQAGFVGDVDELLDLVEYEDPVAEPTTPAPTADTRLELYQKLISTLETLIEKLNQMVQLQNNK